MLNILNELFSTENALDCVYFNSILSVICSYLSSEDLYISKYVLRKTARLTVINSGQK